MNYSWIVNSEDENLRLLAFIKKKIDQKTQEIRYAIEHQGCRVNQKIERFCSRRLRLGEKVEFRLEKRPTLEKQEQAILFEDETILIYAKPARLSSEELAACFELPLVHRLDRDTTGILLFAKNEEMQVKLEQLFKKREMEKSYEAIVHGRCSFERKRLEHPLRLVKRLPGKVFWGVSQAGKLAITDVEVVDKSKEFSYLRLYPKTGRTHQLRVQLSHIGHPIVGDADYGTKESWDRRTLLHASELRFTHPLTHEEIWIRCPPPSDFRQQRERLF